MSESRPKVRPEAVAEHVRELVEQFRRELADGVAWDVRLDEPEDAVTPLDSLRVEPTESV